MRRKSRLFALADYLRGRRTGVTAEQLAERFGVTVRTIYRDLDALRDADLPLEAERGPGGGYALGRGYTLPPLNFTPREAALLVMLGRFAREMRLVPFAETMESALDKVRGALDTPAQRELLRQAEALQFVGIPGAPVARPVARAVEEAWFEGLPLQLAYRDASGARSERTVRIESVLMERTQTLLVCFDFSKGERRSLRLDRIESAAVLRAAQLGLHLLPFRCPPLLGGATVRPAKCPTPSQPSITSSGATRWGQSCSARATRARRCT